MFVQNRLWDSWKLCHGLHLWQFSCLVAQFIALMNPGLNAIQIGRTAAAEIYSTIDRVPAIDGTDDMKGIKLDDSYDGSIEMKRVIFAYP